MTSVEDPKLSAITMDTKDVKLSRASDETTWRPIHVLAALAAFVIGACAAGIPLGVLYDQKEAPAPVYTACWKHLPETDGYGFPFLQQVTAPYLVDANDAQLHVNTMPAMPPVADGAYDYPAEVDAVIDSMSKVTTQAHRDEIALFDSKTVLEGRIFFTSMTSYGLPYEEAILSVYGQVTSVHDSGVAVWKNKLLNSRIRPTSLIQKLYPDKEFTINQGIKVKGKYFQAVVRVMPHSEYPSGSSCVCQAIDEWLTNFWPNLELRDSAGNPVPFVANSTVVLNSNGVAYTAGQINSRCGDTRIEGGMHFRPAIPAGRELCKGMGTHTAQKFMTLVPGLAEGTTTVRQAIRSTPTCGAMCCNSVVGCNTTEQLACAQNCTGAWEMPWTDLYAMKMRLFRLPSRAAVDQSPFARLNFHHIMVQEVFASIGPELSKAETIFQFRLSHMADCIIWNSIASNSATLKAFKFGQSKDAQEPIVRSGQVTSDARIKTTIHAFAAAIKLYLPTAETLFRESNLYNILPSSEAPTIGFEAALTTACGAPEADATTYDASCLQTWYNASPGPARLGQIIAYELLYFRVRDGFNSLGTAGDCKLGSYFCQRFSDTMNYDPENGDCLKEVLGPA